ncbi:MAG: efflux RND transporter permease subunit [Planctomycetota bacterium]|jgi:Cu(I)/Ag(I) efflux system membrane protein CusA/SilA|nr:efflux RND transporter permease subunit [Planctomycetota bacterium]
MITAIIRGCINNRFMVLLLTLVLVAGGLWTTRAITVDAIPDLSDVQVIIRTEFPGQAPRIIEDQVTYPLTTAMLAVPKTKNVRGFSMFGSSFVYIIFEDGTDMYWARSRVLEQLSTVAGRLPSGVSPQLGPDATGVGWVYQYMLTTGAYCPDHPEGLWHDPATNAWYASPDEAVDADQLGRLVHHRVFPEPYRRWLDPESGESYPDPALAPEVRRAHLQLREHLKSGGKPLTRCPLSGQPLVRPDLSLADLRSIQDWYLRYELTTVEGVSEIAAVGGMIRQYQVTVDPVRLQAHDLSLGKIRDAIKRSNQDVGGRLLEQAETEFMIVGQGYLGTLTDAMIEEAARDGIDAVAESRRRVISDLEKIALKVTSAGEPVTLGDVASVNLGPEIRRGVAELNGEGETVGGIVVMRFGENALRTIERVKTRLGELKGGLPPGVDVVTAYDRSGLINRAVHTLTGTLIEEILVVSLIVLVFLLHARSALVAALVLPTGVLGSLILMHVLGINANIMSLGGIAIAIGVMVDSAIIMVENAHNALEREKQAVAAGAPQRSNSAVIADAAAEVGPTLFFSLLIITVSFIPVFVLTGQSGRMFAPLAYTKTFAMGVAAVLSITLIPVAMSLFITERSLPLAWSRGKAWAITGAISILPALVILSVPMAGLASYRGVLAISWVVLSLVLIVPQRLLPEDRNPTSRLLQVLYNPVFALAMRFRYAVILISVVLFAVTWYPASRIGSEFMPPLEEGDFLYMPNTDPGLSVTKAKELLQQTDKLLVQFPEVASVMGKAGRADSATDPAPLTMIETTIALERDKSKWRQREDTWLWGLIRYNRPITIDELTDGYALPNGTWVPGVNEVLRIPGLTGALTRGAMPIRTRIDMLATGIKTPVGVKIMGPDLEVLSSVTKEIENVLRTDPGIAPITASVAADRATGGNYTNIAIDRLAIQRYGLDVADVQAHIMTALGGMTVTWTVEGLERYPVNLRYPRELREDLEQLKEVLVRTPGGTQVPLGQLAVITERKGPPMIKSENARPTSWLYVTPHISDMGGYVSQAKDVIARKVALPPGYSIIWSGQFEYMEEANAKLMVAVPLAFMVIVLLLYMATRSWIQTGIVLLAVPFSAIGAVWLLYLLDYNFSVAVAVGIIALAGLDAETGLVMLHYLEDSCKKFAKAGRLVTRDDLWWAIHDGAVQRIRPKTMTVCTTMIGLLPLMWGAGAGADTMRRLAAPMIGGLATSFIAELVLYPVIWYLIHARTYPGAADENDVERIGEVPGDERKVIT